MRTIMISSRKRPSQKSSAHLCGNHGRGRERMGARATQSAGYQLPQIKVLVSRPCSLAKIPIVAQERARLAERRLRACVFPVRPAACMRSLSP